MKPSYDVVVLANQHNRTFWPFSGVISPPLLPLAGKPIVACLLEILAAFAPIRIGVAVCPWDKGAAAEATRQHWPNVTILPLADLRTDWPEAGVVLRADILPDAAAIAGHLQKPGLGAASRKRRLRPYEGLERALAGQTGASVKDCMLPDAAAYFRIAMLAQRQAIAGVQPEGWMDDDGIRVGTGTTILTRRNPGAFVSVGHNAYVDKSVQLDDFSIIGDGAYVGQGAWINKSIVLPQCFVPPGAKLLNSIICRHWIYNVETGALLTTRNADAAASVA